MCLGASCVPAGQPRPNLCGCPIPDCEPDAGAGGSAGAATGGAIDTGGNGGTTSSGNARSYPEITSSRRRSDRIHVTAPTTVQNNPPQSVTFTTNIAQARDVYQPARPARFPSGTFSCPADTTAVIYQLTFSFADGSALTVMADPSGCPSVAIPGTCVRSRTWPIDSARQ